jgi:hypothetical protein
VNVLGHPVVCLDGLRRLDTAIRKPAVSRVQVLNLELKSGSMRQTISYGCFVTVTCSSGARTSGTLL